MKFFIDNSRLVILITLAFVFLGIRGLKNLQRESIPPVDFARAFIVTVYPGSSAKEVEELITKKIEDEIRAVPHLKDVHSVSQPGLSQITARIDIDNTNSLEVINELSQKLQNVKGLPPEILDPPFLTHLDSTTNRPILNLYVSGSDENRSKDEHAWRLKNNIETIEGVLGIDLSNYKKREFLISLSTKKMDQYYISSNDVVLALQKEKMDIPAGYLESDSKRTLTRLIGNFRTIKELENVVVRSNFAGKSIRIKDIAEVKDHYEKEQEKGYIYSSQKGESFKLHPAVSLSVLKDAGSDIIRLAEKVNQKISQFKTQFQASHEVITGFDESRNTKKRLTSVINNTLFGLLLIFVVFFIFLPSRIGLMASFSLPLSILGVFCFLPFMGVSFNIITMLAFVICIGMLVDNSVVVSEYYARLVLEHNLPKREAAQQVVSQFFKPVTATVLTTIVAFLPMLITKGVMGQFIKWIPIVVSFALLMSLFESFCLLPNRLLWTTQKKPSFYQKALLNKFSQLENLFSIFLKGCVRRRYKALAGIVFLFFITFLVFKFGVKVDLFSSKSPEFYTARIKAQPNLPLSVFDQKTKEIAEKMQTVFGGEKTIDWMSVRSGAGVSDILLKVKPSVLRQLNYKSILEELRKIEQDELLKDLNFNVLVAGPPVGKALNVAFLSNNRGQIRNFIDKIYPEISNVEGLLNLTADPDTDIGTEYKLTVKEEVLAKLGLDFRSVGSALRTALEGAVLTEVTENNESFYIRIKHDEREVSFIEDLKNIKVKELMGRQISLGKVLNFKEWPSEPDRKTYNFSPVVFLTANVDLKKTTSLEVNNKVKRIIEQKIKNYPLIDYKLIGEQETTQESLKSLFQSGWIAFFAILTILVVLFKSFVFSFLILSCIPLGLIGVLWSFFLHGRSLSFFAMIGVVGLAGVVVNSAIILISFIVKMQKEQPEKNLTDIVVSASKIRFRPILITNLTTLGGLLPTAYGIPSFEPLLMPMTLSLFWGLFTATLLTLVWIPCCLLIIEDVKNYFYKKKV